MENTQQTASGERDDRPWSAEPSEDGFYRVVNDLSVVIAQKCVKEEAQLFAAAPELFEALDHLLRQTVDMDLAHGIELTEGEKEARDMALKAIAKASTGHNYGTPS